MTKDLHAQAKALTPWGTQLLSKKPELYAPGLWPSHFSRAEGCRVWDMKGNRYLDFSNMGVGSSILGYADPEVNAAVKAVIDQGTVSSLNPPEEVELAKLLVDIHPWAAQARFARTGGEALAVAIRLARATTGRSRIAACGYHGWHDWYMAANLGSTENLDGHLLPGLQPLGVPRELAGTTRLFHYNKIEELEALVDQDGASLAAICMEPLRRQSPLPGFLEQVRELADSCGALLLFDEVTSGWRFNLGGLHLQLGVNPDLAVFAKGISNGYPMAAVLGNKRSMELADDCFISSSYWTERIGPVAAHATIKAMRDRNIWPTLQKTCAAVSRTWNDSARKWNLPIQSDHNGAFAYLDFQGEEANEAKTLYTQIMLEKGFLSSSALYATTAHEKYLDNFAEAVEDTFSEMSRAHRNGGWKTALRGPISETGFHRIT